MRVLEMEIKAFGCLENRHFSFGDGVNLIYGANEAGKTTLLAFVRAMLFGLERGRGRASREDAYTRYRPWGHPGDYGGWLELELGGIRYRLIRDFASDPRDLRVLDLRTGAEVPDFEERVLRPVGLNESNFRNAMLIEADHGPVSAELAAALGDRLVYMATGGDRELAASRAIESLRVRRRQLERTLPTARLTELEARRQQAALWEQELEILQAEQEKAQALSVGEGQAEKTSQKSGSRRLILYFLPLAAGVALAYLMWPWLGMLALAVPVMLLALCGVWELRHSRRSRQQEQEYQQAREEFLIAEGRRLARMEQLDASLDAENGLVAEWQDVSLQVKRQQEEIAVLNAAESLLQQVSAEVSQGFGIAFAREMEQGLAEIVAGSDTESGRRRLYLDEDFRIRLEESGQIQSLERFSRGTAGQMYLIMSMAASKLLFREEMPLLLDDAMTHYDDGRTQAALAYLHREHQGQIIFCSHGDREAECLERADIAYRYINLRQEFQE